MGQIETQCALLNVHYSYQAQLISARIGLKVLASEAVGASMMMKKEVKSSSFDNCRFTTLLMLFDNIIRHKNH